MLDELASELRRLSRKEMTPDDSARLVAAATRLDAARRDVIHYVDEIDEDLR